MTFQNLILSVKYKGKITYGKYVVLSRLSSAMIVVLASQFYFNPSGEPATLEDEEGNKYFDEKISMRYPVILTWIIFIQSVVSLLVYLLI